LHLTARPAHLVKKVRHASSITVRSGGHNACGADTWTARFTLPLPLHNARLDWASDFPQRDKRKNKGSNCLPYSAVIIIFLLAHRSCVASLLPFPVRFWLIIIVMGKRSSTAAGAATGAAAKKAKTVDADTPTIGNWVQTKFLEKELQSAKKTGILKNDPAEILIAEPEIIPRPPAGFRVLFLAFLLWGFSFPPHPFLHGLLFAYGIQLHDLNPNTILHIACFITLCECFLGIETHWALWRRIFVIRRPLHYQTGGFSCQVR
jgi:hypothetical protein